VEERAAAAGQLWDRVLVLAERARAEDWTRPTPCEDWDVHDLFAHLSGVQTGFDNPTPPAQPQPPPVGPQPEGMDPFDAQWAAGIAARREWAPHQVVDELHAARAGHVARLAGVSDWDAPARGPLGETTEAGLYQVRCFDLWVHGWDLATALGQPFELDDDAPGAVQAYRYALDLVPWMFAKKVGAADGATLRLRLSEPLAFDRVLALHGRRAGWDDQADPGECLVAGKPAALTLLTSGRGTPEGWRDAGALDWDGPRGREFVHRARMFT
jgi:uncharacterized protein (TIGR03083 family)